MVASNKSSQILNKSCNASEPAEGGQEVVLKLRLSSNCQDVKLPLYTNDTIGMAKKKLEVRSWQDLLFVWVHESEPEDEFVNH